MSAHRKPDDGARVPAALLLVRITVGRCVRRYYESEHPLANAFGVAAIGTTTVVAVGIGAVYLAEKAYEAAEPFLTEVIEPVVKNVFAWDRDVVKRLEKRAATTPAAAAFPPEPYAGLHRAADPPVDRIEVRLNAGSVLGVGIGLTPRLDSILAGSLTGADKAEPTVDIALRIGTTSILDLNLL